MKYSLLCLCALVFTLLVSVTPQVRAQTLTPQEIKGCYYHRFEINIDSLISAIELNVCMDDQNQFVIQIHADKIAKNYWGSYTIDHDTLHFTLDPYFQEFHLGTRYNKKIKQGSIKVSVHDTPIGLYGITLSTFAQDSINELYYVSDFESKDSVFSKIIAALPGDKIQLTDDYGSRKTYSYIVPEKTNEIYVIRNVSNFFTADLKAWKTNDGIAVTETNNRNSERIDTLQYISFDANMFAAHQQHAIPEGYTYLSVSEIIDPPADNYSYDDTYYTDTTAYADYYGSKDTVHYVTDYKTALKQAKDSSRYLLLYYDAKGCIDCGRHALKEVLQAWNDPYTYYDFPVTFNSQYIFYVAPEKDSLRFKTFGAAELPAAIILTPDEKPLYIAHGKTLDLTRPGFGGYDAPAFYEKLKLHETFTYLPEKIKASGYDSTYINQYLQALPLSSQYQNEIYYNDGMVDVTAPALLPVEPDTAAYDVAADPYIPDSLTAAVADDNYTDYGYVYPPAVDDNFYSTLTLRADTAFAQAILDSLVSKYYIHAPADSARAANIVSIVYQFDDYYCPFYSSSFLTTNDTIFNPRISFQYLIRNYNSLSRYSYLSDMQYSGYNVSLYELISKWVNRFIQYIETSNAEKQKALTFQKELIKHLPQLRYLEMPLYITNLVVWYDTLQHMNLQDKFVTDYLNEIGGNAAVITKTDAIMQKLRRENTSDAMNYDYSNNYYYYLGGNYRYNIDDDASIRYGYYKHAETLNHVAWHYYEHVADKEKLKQALTWSQSSLVLDPENPYFLDTYAHLLYKTGKTKEAVKIQKKAVSKLSSKKLRFEIDDAQAETIRADYAKMKNKTL